MPMYTAQTWTCYMMPGAQEKKLSSETLRAKQKQNQSLPVRLLLKPGSAACRKERNTFQRKTSRHDDNT